MICKFEKSPVIISSAAVGGMEEYLGMLGSTLDYFDGSGKFNRETWEEAEGEMQRIALNLAMNKAHMKESDIKLLAAGDLMNQCSSSNYGLVDFDIPFFGLYGACSTAAQGIAFIASMVNAGYIDVGASVTSSHFCSAERQFRFPLEYGGQRTPTAQRTVTGAGAFVTAAKGTGVYVREAMFGKSMDGGVDDLSNMGGAMAIGAVNTLYDYFTETGSEPGDYSLILTGDLGWEGYKIVLEMCEKYKFDLSANYNDCGLMIYDRKEQDMHAGGSGCACSALILSCEVIPKMLEGKYKDVLFIGTGALMNPTAIQQGLCIPSIAHLVRLSNERA